MIHFDNDKELFVIFVSTTFQRFGYNVATSCQKKCPLVNLLYLEEPWIVIILIFW